MELEELDGVGEVTAKRIRAAGANDVSELAQMATDDLTEQGLSESKADTLISRASRQSVVIQTAGEAKQEKEAKEHITTGMDALDDVLGGGYLQGHVIGIAGASSTGKTQTAFRALGAAVEQTGNDAIYIETERDRFDAQRVANLSQLSEKEVYDSVHRIKAHDLDVQRETYDAVREQFDSVGIVVVDSFTAQFRLTEEFTQGRTSLSDRNAEMVTHLNRIDRMVSSLGCPCLLTLQVMGNPERFGGSNSTWGGSIMDHQITYFIKTSKAQGEFRKATLAGHPSQPEGEVLVSIGEDHMEASQDG